MIWGNSDDAIKHGCILHTLIHWQIYFPTTIPKVALSSNLMLCMTLLTSLPFAGK